MSTSELDAYLTRVFRAAQSRPKITRVFTFRNGWNYYMSGKTCVAIVGPTAQKAIDEMFKTEGLRGDDPANP